MVALIRACAGARVRHFVAIARSEDMTKDLIQIRCDRGASIARQLGFPAETAEAIRYLETKHARGKVIITVDAGE